MNVFPSSGKKVSTTELGLIETAAPFPEQPNSVSKIYISTHNQLLLTSSNKKVENNNSETNCEDLNLRENEMFFK
jgi:hypothetical protein